MMVIRSVVVPSVVGAKETWMAQLQPLDGKSVPQSFVCVKSVPASMLVMPRDALPALISIAIWAGLVKLRT